MKSKNMQIILLLSVAVFAASYLSAVFVDFSYFTAFWLKMRFVFIFDLLIVLFLAFAFNLNRVVLSAAGFGELLKIFMIDTSVLIFNILYRLFTQDASAVRWRWCAMNFILLALFIFGFAFFKRGFKQFKNYLYLRTTDLKDRAIIIGAGEAGTMLLQEMMLSSSVNTVPVCVLDDDKQKRGLTICGVKIEGSIKSVAKFVAKYKATKIIIAIPSATKSQMRKIVENCSGMDVKVLTVPGVSQIINDQISFSTLREVDICDLLGRDQIQVNMEEIHSCIENKVVLVTGGGGSIGSELCRQIAKCKPKKLIVFDIYENNAYDIEMELRHTYPKLHLLVLIGSIRDKGKVEKLFSSHKPQVVFNAAAHKHVPLMETSPNEAIKNNVFGTLNVAKAADRHQAEKFVQISTDKAVNPTNIMGASKRICEMIIQTIGRHSEHTDFVAVRFGNVLASNGSVVPLFKSQIAEGGPVTVTHKNITRYFMTIPEAVSLVLQACCYAKGGEIFVFDMGEPVRIYDLAYKLIELSGLIPNVDIDIVCTGLRPGEKLYEERLMEEEGMAKTENELISIGKPIPIDEESFWKTLDELYQKAYEETDKMKELVAKLVPTYRITENDAKSKKANDGSESIEKDDEKSTEITGSYQNIAASPASYR